MKQSFLSRLLSCSLLIIFMYGSSFAVEVKKKKLNDYELIGLDFEELQREVFEKVRSDKPYDDARKEMLAAKDPLAHKKAEEKKEKIREKIENEFYTKKVQAACKDVRKKYREMLEDAQKVVEEADEFEREKK